MTTILKVHGDLPKQEFLADIEKQGFIGVSPIRGAQTMQLECRGENCKGKALLYENQDYLVSACHRCGELNEVKARGIEPDIALEQLIGSIKPGQKGKMSKILYMCKTALYYWQSKHRFIESAICFDKLDAETSKKLSYVMRSEHSTRKLSEWCISALPNPTTN
ncbi:hypothetical protein L1D14_22995 [Vibrio tubiashii]|uniref:hypothetical protein n=1 Tax=Vibrio tubiashii TaxID=29498 RepID=UPI001EFC9D59|nr:hypothetical protein [Vibrio tubiashii]MCG9579072.1 hypothetical protein [Vibrio tubiashii]